MYTSLMPYRTMELPDSLRPPAKWPRRAVLAAVTFVAIASGFMVLVELAAQIDGPGVGYGSRAVIVMMITAVAGFLGSLVLGVRWPTARAVGWSSGAAVAIAFIALRVPLHLLQASWSWRCDRGEGAACHGLGDERRACQNGYAPSCTLLNRPLDE